MEDACAGSRETNVKRMTPKPILSYASGLIHESRVSNGPVDGLRGVRRRMK